HHLQGQRLLRNRLPLRFLQEGRGVRFQGVVIGDRVQRKIVRRKRQAGQDRLEAIWRIQEEQVQVRRVSSVARPGRARCQTVGRDGDSPRAEPSSRELFTGQVQAVSVVGFARPYTLRVAAPPAARSLP